MVEMLIAISIMVVLVTLIFVFSRRAMEKTKYALDLARMHQIAGAISARAMEYNGRAYTKELVGNSMYRSWDDPLSLCQLLEDYLPPEDTWLGPASLERHEKYKNSYAWSVSANITGKTVNQITNPENTIVLWNNFGYTIPSVKGVPESTTAGPRQAPKQYHYRPWKGRTAVNWLYLDGHVETF